ncbi:hypothetical protein [Halobaculum sp. D14]|uniref:hypothetical protein n=1 Tax=Halobaculum sp. D14 TaxID=3421642 RepID=UPI003EBE4211
MTVMLNIVGGVMAGFVTFAMVQGFGPSELSAWVAAAVAGLAGFLLWTYSPLPDHNGGFMSGPQNTDWGWRPTNEEGDA